MINNIQVPKNHIKAPKMFLTGFTSICKIGDAVIEETIMMTKRNNDGFSYGCQIWHKDSLRKVQTSAKFHCPSLIYINVIFHKEESGIQNPKALDPCRINTDNHKHPNTWQKLIK